MRYAMRQLFVTFRLKTYGKNYRINDVGKIVDTVRIKCDFSCLLLTLIHILGFNMVSLFAVVTTKKLALMIKIIAVARDQDKV